MQHFKLLVVAGAMTGLVAGAQAQAPSNPDEIIAARQAGYKHIGDVFGAMKKGIDGGQDVQQYAAGAKEIADWGRKVPSLFPPGTETGHNTHATPAVWSDRATFDKNAADMTAQADKLAQIASTGDKAAFATQWQAVGGTCGSCHANQKFRTRL